MNPDKNFLQRAIDLSKQSQEPVPCGVVLVKDRDVLSEAYNSQRADEITIYHAEIKALLDANHQTGSRKLKDVVAYCSCEPCPMCATALSLAHVSAIYYAASMKDMSPDDPMVQQYHIEDFVEMLRFTPEVQKLDIP